MRQERNSAKIGLIGTDSYSNKRKLRDFVFSSKKTFNVQIIGCGKESGFDETIRDICHELRISYGEFPPFYELYTHLCILPKRYYDKKFSIRYKYAAIKAMINYCDFIVFCEEGNEEKSDQYEYAKKFCKKNGKITQNL